MRNITKIALLIAFVVVAAATSCTKKSTISGSLPEGVDSTAYVVLYNEANNTPIDSVQFSNGAFQLDFAPVSHGEALYTLRISCTQGSLFIVPEAGNIKVDSTFSYAEGTPKNDEFATLFTSLRKIGEDLQAQLEAAGDDVKIDDLYDKAMSDSKEKTINFFMEHKEEPLCLAALQLYRNFDGSLDKVKELLDATENRFEDYNMVVKLREQIAQFEATQAGKTFTDLEGVQFTKEGSQPIKLSDYVGQGQYAVVDFWASWCRPCREEISKNLKPLYEKYRNKGLAVVGVVVWDKEEDHKKAVEELNVTWPQIFDTEGTKLAQQYAVSSIPQILLIGPDGTILARDLRGEDLVKAIESNFN